MATYESENPNVPTNGELQTWANDSDAARANVKSLFAAIQCAQEEAVNWATEALENMGPPSVGDIGWLGSVISSSSTDAVYWAITLLARCDDSIDAVQDYLAKIVASNESSTITRRRAITALAKVHARSDATESAIKIAMNSGDSQLANLAKELLQPA